MLTAGHVSTCPRMLKAADALHEAGHSVRLVAANFIPWAADTDRSVRARRAWRVTLVDYAKTSAPVAAAITSARWRTASAAARVLRPGAAPWWAITRAYSRAQDELVSAALVEPADFYYGGTTGGLAATEEAARRAGARYALDLEDWHLGESVAPYAPMQHALAARILPRVLSDAAFLTAGSEPMAAAYVARFGVHPVPIHNVFPLPAAAPPLDADGDRLRVCWFGQTIGPDRGLEEIVDVAVAAGVAVDLHIRGRLIPEFGRVLEARAAAAASLRLTFLPPLDPDALQPWCSQFHVGVYADPLVVENRFLCVSNKVCTFLLAGLAILTIDAPGQRRLIESAGEGAAVYASGDVRSGAQALRRWFEDRAALARARRASWSAACTRWHWEHPEERGRLLQLVDEVAA